MIAMGNNMVQPWVENPQKPNSKANMRQWYLNAVFYHAISPHINGECSNDEASMPWHANKHTKTESVPAAPRFQQHLCQSVLGRINEGKTVMLVR
jgi:hypothetical protein